MGNLIDLNPILNERRRIEKQKKNILISKNEIQAFIKSLDDTQLYFFDKFLESLMVAIVGIVSITAVITVILMSL